TMGRDGGRLPWGSGAAPLVQRVLLVAAVPAGLPGGGHHLGRKGLRVERLAGESGHVALLVGLVQAFQAPVVVVFGGRHGCSPMRVSPQASPRRRGRRAAGQERTVEVADL